MVHPTAVIHPKAEIGEDVEIGPYVVIEEGVKIGAQTKIGPGVVIKRGVCIGKKCVICTGAVIGEMPQIKGLEDSEGQVIIGDRSVIREYVTVHRSKKEGGVTYIGNDNYLMAGVHIAHDCIIQDSVVMANCAMLAGHVVVENRAFLSGFIGVHQFSRIGTLAMIGGFTKLNQDVPPYTIVDGIPGKVYGLNIIGLKRAQVPVEVIYNLKKAYKILYHSSLNRIDALKKIEEELPNTSEIAHLLTFIRTSTRGICTPKKRLA